MFWWHVKLQPHIGRVYFLYEPAPEISLLPENGRIIIGLFKDHCIIA